MEDDADDKMRMIKYTPKFSFSYAVFYGPSYAVGTSFVGVQRLYETDEFGN
jgi:hypothetical protein